MAVLVITGTGTEVGKTVTTAAVAATALAAGRSVAVLKPAQTGVRPDERGDADEVARLAGAVTTLELARYPEPLAPATAARRASLPPVSPVAGGEGGGRTGHRARPRAGRGSGRSPRPFRRRGRHAGGRGEPAGRAGAGGGVSGPRHPEHLRTRRLVNCGAVGWTWRDSSSAAGPTPPTWRRVRAADLPVVAEAPLLGALPAGAGAHPVADFCAQAPGGWPLGWAAPGTPTPSFRRRGSERLVRGAGDCAPGHDRPAAGQRHQPPDRSPNNRTNSIRDRIPNRANTPRR